MSLWLKVSWLADKKIMGNNWSYCYAKVHGIDNINNLLNIGVIFTFPIAFIGSRLVGFNDSEHCSGCTCKEATSK